MNFQTSDEAFKEYERLRNIENKRNLINYGLSLMETKEVSPKPHWDISVNKVGKQNLTSNSFEVKVETNLPISKGVYYWGGYSIKDFLEFLADYVKVPQYKPFIQYNRKQENKISWGKLKAREEFIAIDDVSIDIKENAKEFLGKEAEDFIKKVTELLKLQRKATKEEEIDFERINYLLEVVDNFRKRVKQERYYSSNKINSSFYLSKEEYNLKLKEFEDELTELHNKYPYFSMPHFYYEEIRDDEDDEEEYDEDYDEDDGF